MCVMRAVAVVAALVCLKSGVQARVPDAGGVAGRVVLAGRIRGVPLPSNAYQPRAVSQRRSESAPEIRNVVVYLANAPFSGALPTTRTQIRQTNEAFTPRVV